MSFVTTKPPLPVRVVNAAGIPPGTFGLARARLKVDPLLRAATLQTGLTDFRDPGFPEGLRVLPDSVERDANLHPNGRLGVRQVVVDGLVNRLLLTEAQRHTPEIIARPLTTPLIVMGPPRSGTTFLHHLVAEDPAHHAPRQWELSSPLPGRNDTRRRKARAPGVIRLAHGRATLPRLATEHGRKLRCEERSPVAGRGRVLP